MGVHGISWYIIGAHGISRYIDGSSRYIMGVHGISWMFTALRRHCDDSVTFGRPIGRPIGSGCGISVQGRIWVHIQCISRYILRIYQHIPACRVVSACRVVYEYIYNVYYAIYLEYIRIYQVSLDIPGICAHIPGICAHIPGIWRVLFHAMVYGRAFSLAMSYGHVF
jgi:hypothetical protein